VWKEEEISAMVKICRENNVIIVSDEIHSDLLLEGHRHIPVLFYEDSTPVTVACYSPSKTFNLAGLSTSFLIIPDKDLRKKYEKTLNDLHIGLGNLFGFVALEAAYNHGGKWLDELLLYLNANVLVTQNFIKTRIPEIKLVKPEATYLMWLDFSELGLNDKELRDFIINKAGLGLNDGPVFGSGGSGFQRMNIALPKQKLESALMSLERALRNT
jgi:cystathionine beta-lyase